MRERITLVHAPEVAVDPSALSVNGAGLKAPPLTAAREDRLTVALDGLPIEVAQVLQDFQELHVRWASTQSYETLDPFASRISPGLHVSYTPVGDKSYDPSRLCSALQIFGQLDCMSREAFTATKNQHSSGSPTLYFYQPLEDLKLFSKSLVTDLCHGDEACQSKAQDLDSAVSFDFTFDSETKVSKLTALWPLQEQPVQMEASATRRKEVGILAKGTPNNMGEHDIGLGGVLAVLGETKTPSATLFAFPSRHRLSKAQFSSQILSPTGLHPALQIKLSDNQPPHGEDAECKPHAYLTLPKSIFADRYQLDDPLFMASKNLTASRYTSLPVDLEAPAYTTKTWGSSVLLEMAPPSSSDSQAWTAEVPLHLRYLEPSPTGERHIEIPYPAVFWACQADETADFNNNPFDRQKIGYDDLFPSNTVFWHSTPQPEQGDRLVNQITVPVLKDEAASWIGLGTAAVIALGFAWVVAKIAGSAMGGGSSAGKGKGQVQSKKKPTPKKTQ